MMRLAKKNQIPARKPHPTVRHLRVRKVVAVIKPPVQDENEPFADGFFYMATPRPFFLDLNFGERQPHATNYKPGTQS